jgi:hypothetical protein
VSRERSRGDLSSVRFGPDLPQLTWSGLLFLRANDQPLAN